VRLREEVIIETQLISYEKMVGKLLQKIVRAGEYVVLQNYHGIV